MRDTQRVRGRQINPSRDKLLIVKHMLSKMALTLWRSMLTGIYPERASLVVMSSRGCSTMQSTTSLIASLYGK